MKSAILLTTGRGVPDSLSLTWREMFQRGLQRRGWRATISERAKRCDLLVMWGTARRDAITDQLARGGEVIVLERGFIGDRFAWTSVSFGGGLNGRGEFRGPVEDGSRFAKLFPNLMQPWRTDGDGRPLIMEQVKGDRATLGADMPGFYSSALAAFPEARFRRHPQCSGITSPEKREAAWISLQFDLASASIVITWNSNSAVDAVMAGVPTIAMDRGSMAWDVTGHKLAAPPTPDRQTWANRLAWCQYSEDEMSSGFCQEMIGL